LLSIARGTLRNKRSAARVRQLKWYTRREERKTEKEKKEKEKKREKTKRKKGQVFQGFVSVAPGRINN